MTASPRKPRRDAADYGPKAAMSRREVVDAADPDSPARTVRRARVTCHYDAAWRRGALSDGEREAADRYAQESDREAGARDRPNPDSPPARTPPWMQGHPAHTAVQAASVLRAAHAVVGMDGAALLRLWVRDNLAVDVIAKRRGEDGKVCAGRIRATLGRLAEHWGM